MGPSVSDTQCKTIDVCLPLHALLAACVVVQLFHKHGLASIAAGHDKTWCARLVSSSHALVQGNEDTQSMKSSLAECSPTSCRVRYSQCKVQLFHQYCLASITAGHRKAWCAVLCPARMHLHRATKDTQTMKQPCRMQSIQLACTVQPMQGEVSLCASGMHSARCAVHTACIQGHCLTLAP